MPNSLPLRYVALAQNAEDVVLCRTFDNAGVVGGFYVDAGAGHPVHGSLTWNLVHGRGWSGIDIEPQAHLAEKLRQDRPENIVVDCALGNQAGELVFYHLVDNWGMSTLDAAVASRHREAGWGVVEQHVKVRRLAEVLDQYAHRPIDLLKIDVEGFEREVLEGADLALWCPGVLVVEATAPASTTATHESWEGLVLDAGYQLCLFDGLNRFYVHESRAELGKDLSIPANVFDRYVLVRWWEKLSDNQRRSLDPEGTLPR